MAFAEIVKDSYRIEGQCILFFGVMNADWEWQRYWNHDKN